MENKLERSFPVKEGNLDFDHYTLSLLREAGGAGALEKDEINRFHCGVMNLLAERILKYTGGESSSVREETAQNLMQCIFYCIDRVLMSFHSPERAAESIKTVEVPDLFRRGAEIVRRDLAHARQIFEKVRDTRITTDLIAYNGTINVALPGFFQMYEIEFAAHETPAVIDYPLAVMCSGGSGAAYILHYLRSLAAENEFCSHFERAEIDALLESCGAAADMDYRHLLINIFELAANNCIFSAMSRRAVRGFLLFSKEEYEKLADWLSGLSELERSRAADGAVADIIAAWKLEGSPTAAYLKGYSDLLKRRISAASKDADFAPLVMIGCAKAPKLEFCDGPRMDDESLRAVIDKIMRAVPSQKIEIIGRTVSSLDDFTEILGAECLYGEEYDGAFELLSDAELTVLASRVLPEELRCRSNISSIDTAQKEEWEKKFISYLRGLPCCRIDAILERAVLLQAKETGGAD